MPPTEADLRPSILVVGVGGAGGNAVNNMIQSQLEGVDFVVANTDAQALSHSRTDRRVQLGTNITSGLGAGSRPDIGQASAEESIEDILAQLVETNMAFITAGMGGGTGTGAAPVVAQIAREQGALTVGIVTEPFMMEGFPRMRNALAGITELQEHVDTLITIKNQRLLTICSRDTTLQEAFFKADEVLMQATRGIADLITVPGIINLDFNDVKTIIADGGDAIMGVGIHRGENRAIEGAKKAIKSPLLEEVSIEGAKKVLINIAADSNLTLFEVNEAMSLIYESVGQEANIIFGTVLDDDLVDEIRITVIATGFNLNKEDALGIDREEQVPAKGIEAANNLGVPAVIRRTATGTDDREGVSGRSASENLDYPTFLRKKMGPSATP
ncbi:MAG: cell division protein FtsZ [Gemmatimonadetes bacterium]|nr:cell division protein FtsZ [Gemmatimonadota bacterium]